MAAAASGSDPPLHAPTVCGNCKNRKKKCDKIVPRCGYCTKKNVECHYPQRKSAAHHGVSIRGVPDSPPALAGMPHRNSVVCSSLLLMDTITNTALSDWIPRHAWEELPPTVDITICMQAQRIIGATGQYLDEISVRYFQGIHNFVPIISRKSFHDHLFSFSACPRADFSILLLSICLVTYQGHKGHLADTALYLATKTLFIQALVLCPPSLHLIQAGILLAVYEYAHGKPEHAFLSIGSCARMAQAVGLKHPSSLAAAYSASDKEETNVWWGILICERTFLCELAVVDQPLMSVIPGADCCLPIESPAWDQTSPGLVPIAYLTASRLGGFGRAAQAAWLLDQVLKALRIPDLDSKWTELDKLDTALQSFLGMVMKQSHQTWGVYCTAIAIAIRTLFLLHWHVLGQSTDAASSELKLPQGPSSNSRAALDTATKMVVDIADSYEHIPLNMLDTLPPSCAYIIRAALKHIHDQRQLAPDAWLLSAEARLQDSLSRFNRRWSVGGDEL